MRRTIPANKVRLPFGCKNNKNLAWLRPIVRRWANVTECYVNKTGYAGYYFNERANIGFLAAGAWLSGALALEEYSDTKHHLPKKSGAQLGTEKKNGRVDLYIARGKNSATIEAKALWSAPPKTGFPRKLESAINDAKKDRGARQKLACVFYVPSFSTENKSMVDDEIIQNEVARISEEKTIDLLAWCFPRKARELRGGGLVWSKFYYPGVILALKAVRV